jgi:carbohydrate diacid regulator
MLTPSLAQEIARDTSAVIGFNVLITNSDGIVIGSGDVDRVGSFHEASIEVMHTHELATHTSSEAHQLRGVRPGITLPLIIDGHPVGTVGITGAPARVRRFGLVVKRQTEILLQESAMLRSRLLRERAVEDLLRDIAGYDADLVEPDLVLFRATELGYDLALPRVVAVLDVTVPAGGPHRHGPALDVTVLRAELLRTIREVFADPQDVVTGVAAGRFAVLHRVPGHTPWEADERTRAGCRRVIDVIGRHHQWMARAAVGGLATSVAGLHDSYQDACDALRIGARIAQDVAVHTIRDYRIHQVASAVGHRTRARLVDLVVGPALRGQPDWPELRRTLVTWCENGFSLVRTAAALHVHRNTLLYRLAKIEKLTARGIRDHRWNLALYVACLADQLDEQPYSGVR